MNFWTLAVFGAIGFNFIQNGSFKGGLDALLAIYIALLAIYAGDKEFEQWHDHHSSRHPGEIYVVLWTLIIVALVIGDFIFKKDNAGLTSEIAATYIAVLSILAITRRSKAVYQRKRRRTASPIL